MDRIQDNTEVELRKEDPVETLIERSRWSLNRLHAEILVGAGTVVTLSAVARNGVEVLLNRDMLGVLSLMALALASIRIRLKQKGRVLEHIEHLAATGELTPLLRDNEQRALAAKDAHALKTLDSVSRTYLPTESPFD